MSLPVAFLQTFTSLGKKMEDYVPLKRVLPAAYRVWYEALESETTGNVSVGSHLYSHAFSETG